MHTYWMMAVASAAVLGSTTVSVNAAPANGMVMKPNVQAASVVDQVAYRCWWRDGERFCGRRVERGYGYDYGRPRPEALPFGSTAWWRAMDYEGRGGHSRR